MEKTFFLKKKKLLISNIGVDAASNLLLSVFLVPFFSLLCCREKQSEELQESEKDLKVLKLFWGTSERCHFFSCL